jgi:hypothetical protein
MLKSNTKRSNAYEKEQFTLNFTMMWEGMPRPHPAAYQLNSHTQNSIHLRSSPFPILRSN